MANFMTAPTDWKREKIREVHVTVTSIKESANMCSLSCQAGEIAKLSNWGLHSPSLVYSARVALLFFSLHFSLIIIIVS